MRYGWSVFLLAVFLFAGLSSTANPAHAQGSEPDLIIESVTWTPEEFSKGDTLNFSAVVKNQGSGASLPSTVKMYADGSLKKEQHLSGMEADGTQVIAFTWLAEQGTHTIRFVVDEDAIVSESDENNNEKSVTVSSLAPDLIVDSITWLPQSPLSGENVTFTFTIKNQGNGAVQSVLGIPYMGSVRLDSVSFGAMEPGETGSVSLEWPVAAGVYDVKLVLDPNDRILESDENNNEKLVGFTPILPDVYVNSINWEPVNPSVDEMVTFSIEIGNKGLAPAAITRFHLYLDGKSSVYNTTGPIMAGASETVDIEWAAGPGKHSIRVVADPYDGEKETDEENNEKTASSLLGVREADIYVSSASWTPAEPAVGENLTFLVTVKNRGYGEAAYTHLDVYIDNVKTFSSTIPQLSYGAVYKEQVPWIVEEGSHTIRIVADADDRVYESDEKNNEKLVYYPLPPDLAFGEINFVPAMPAEGDNVTFTMTVMNEGSIAVDYFSIACDIDGEYLDYVSGEPLEPGAAANYTVLWAAELGDHNFRAVLDHFDKIFEADEENNEVTEFIAVARSSTAPSSETEKNDGVSKEPANVTIPESTESSFDIEKSNLWFFSLLAIGIIIVLSYVFFEYRRRKQ
jgi:subtilase family serine protease